MAETKKKEKKKPRKFVVGQKVIVFRQRHLSPIEGKILVITADPTKQIGIVFDKPKQPGGGVLDLDGRCKEGHGRWVRAHEIFTDAEFEANLNRMIHRKVKPVEEFESLTLVDGGELVLK